MALHFIDKPAQTLVKPTELRGSFLAQLQDKGNTISLQDGTVVELIAHIPNTEDPNTNPEKCFSLGYFTASGETPVVTTGNTPNLNTDTQFECTLSTEQSALLKNSEPVIKKADELGLDTSKIVSLSVGVNVVSGGASPSRK